MIVFETIGHLKLRFFYSALRHTLYTFFFLLCVRLLLVNFISFELKFKLIAATVGCGILVITWRKLDWAISGFVAFLPLISGLQIHSFLREKPIFELMFACVFVAWFTRRIIISRIPITKVSPISDIVDLLAGVVIVSAAAVSSQYPPDLVLYTLSSVPLYSQIDPLWCLNAAFILLTGFFFYRLLELEFAADQLISIAIVIFILHALTIISFSFFQWIYKTPQLPYGQFGIYSPFDDNHSYGSYLLFLFFVFFSTYIQKTGKVRFAYTFLSFVLLFLILLSSSRASWIALAIVGFIYLIYKSKKWYGYAIMGGLVIGVVCINLFPQIVSTSENFYIKRLGSFVLIHKLVEDEAVIRRAVIWQRAINISKEFPMSGSGIGTFYKRSTYFQDPNDARFSDFKENTHNYYLQLGAELGIPAVFLFLVILYHIYGGAWELRQTNGSHLDFVNCAVLGMSGYLLTMITGHPLLLAKQQVLFWFIVAALMTPLYEAAKSKKSTRPRNYAKYLIFGLALLSLVAQIYKLFNFDKKPSNYAYGYYDYEYWQGENVRWTWRRAVDSVRATDSLIGFKLLAHPSNSNGPEGLNIRIFLDGKPWDEINLFDGGERSLHYYVPFAKNKNLEIRTEVNRTFIPQKMGLSGDNRELGVAVSPVKAIKKMPHDGIGFYPLQTWEGEPWDGWPGDMPLKFRWSGNRATLNLEGNYPNGLRIFLKVAHPDIQNTPVNVRIDQNGRRWFNQVFKDDKVHVVELTPEQLSESRFLNIVVDRTWNSRKMGVADDNRDLGVAVAILEN